MAAITLLAVAVPVLAADATAIGGQKELASATWKDILREFLREGHRRTGGDPDQWPESTIDQAPMNFVQAVYEQMGGDPAALDLSDTPKDLVEETLYAIYVAVGGEDAGETLVDEIFESRLMRLWEFFASRGGQPVKN